jgi:hypothetical protein
MAACCDNDTKHTKCGVVTLQPVVHWLSPSFEGLATLSVVLSFLYRSVSTLCGCQRLDYTPSNGMMTDESGRIFKELVAA